MLGLIFFFTFYFQVVRLYCTNFRSFLCNPEVFSSYRPSFGHLNVYSRPIATKRKQKHVSMSTVGEANQTQHMNPLPPRTQTYMHTPPHTQACGLNRKNGTCRITHTTYTHTSYAQFSGLCSHHCLSPKRERKAGGKVEGGWGYQVKQLQASGPGVSMTSCQQLLVLAVEILQGLLARRDQKQRDGVWCW